MNVIKMEMLLVDLYFGLYISAVQNDCFSAAEVFMKIFGFFLLLFIIAIGGGFAYFAFMDAPVQTQQVIKDIPNEQFYKS